jgi:hypothetical protein
MSARLIGSGARVSITTVRDNGTVLGEAAVDENGNWSFMPDAALSEGEHDFTFAAAVTGGIYRFKSEVVLTFTQRRVWHKAPVTVFVNKR